MHFRDKIKHFVKLVCLITEVNDKEKMCLKRMKTFLEAIIVYISYCFTSEVLLFEEDI